VSLAPVLQQHPFDALGRERSSPIRLVIPVDEIVAINPYFR